MKKLFAFIVVCNLILACNNSDSSTSTDSTANQTNVENVNGNMPDSNSGMRLNRSLPTDSSGLKDSVRQ